MDKLQEKILKKISSRAVLNDPINPDLYEKYDVKRGLRNANGTGVLVGLTRIGDVVGYKTGSAGEKISVPGRLLYRGYDIIDLIKDAESHDDYCYEQCVYLLLMGELPTESELETFKEFLGHARFLPENFTNDMILNAPSPDIMNKLARGVLANYSFDKNPEDRSVINVMRQCIELIARFPTMAAYSYQALRRLKLESMYIHNPVSTFSTAENFLHLIRPDGNFSRLEAETLDLALIIHAEHGGGNNSSLTVHVVASADTDTYSAIAAAVGSLKGRKHGGANIRVVEMMDEIKASVQHWNSEDEIRAYLYKIATREAFDKTGLIYGMGHAVYTISDPRVLLLRDKAKKLAEEKGRLEEFELYNTIERIAPQILMELHSSAKGICANVDLYSGFVYDMLGIPRELFTPVFAISRIAGWSAHRMEELIAGGRIYRPAYKNVCEERTYIPIDERKK
ncbi:MAG: citrate/2-methylcitrate synthase [Treponema sp.]|nr:citrate/2-methylcitrate synthase [Treponema sp.]MBD5414297.1 citrate/2-methylcitrate synthase [Treponema sp.]MBD5442064.1 citrate/2-methylcitrate synthase [Treponema sp.]